MSCIGRETLEDSVTNLWVDLLCQHLVEKKGRGGDCENGRN